MLHFYDFFLIHHIIHHQRTLTTYCVCIHIKMCRYYLNINLNSYIPLHYMYISIDAYLKYHCCTFELEPKSLIIIFLVL